MSKCRYESLIDGYLLDKLKPGERAEFEEHYFVCRSCFAKMSERDELIRILKTEGVLTAPAEQPARGERAGAWIRGAWASLTPRRWAAVGVSAAAVILGLWLIMPRAGTVAPPLVLTGDDAVRGAAVTAVAPVAGVPKAPAFLEWRSAGDGMEYRVSLSGKSPLLTASTRETRLALPEDVRARLKAGAAYTWQVQAFKADGTLAAVSSRIAFKILPKP